MESQSGHHPGHHGHSAPHNSTLPHAIHVGGSNASHHQINLDNHSHNQKHSSQHHHSKAKAVETHKTHHHTSHHSHHHHVSKKSRLNYEFIDFFICRRCCCCTGGMIVKTNFVMGMRKKIPSWKMHEQVFAMRLREDEKRDQWKITWRVEDNSTRQIFVLLNK